MNRLVIIGASGHGKVVSDIAVLSGYKDIVFLDDDENLESCNGFPIVGKTYDAPDGDIFVAVGNSEKRKQLLYYYEERPHPILIHPRAVIADGVEIGEATVVMAGAVINPGTKVGRGCIVNTCSSIDHDCFIGDFTHVAVGAHLCGTVMVGNDSWIGAGAIVSNNISICGNCIIGAGAVVIRNITEAGTYMGIPAKSVNH